jgi:hypothetical protein
MKATPDERIAPSPFYRKCCRLLPSNGSYAPTTLARRSNASLNGSANGISATRTELPGFILLVRLLATTGMRLSELLGVQWRDATAGVSTDKQGARAWPGSAESRVEAICHPADGLPAMSLYKSTLAPFSATLSLRAVSGSSCPIVLKNSDPPLQSTSNVVIISIPLRTIIIYGDRNRN